VSVLVNLPKVLNNLINVYDIERLEDRIVRDVWKTTCGLIMDTSSVLTWSYCGTRRLNAVTYAIKVISLPTYYICT
jgi:hypothetical protein